MRDRIADIIIGIGHGLKRHQLKALHAADQILSLPIEHEEACHECEDRGEIYCIDEYSDWYEPCPTCKGEGKVVSDKKTVSELIEMFQNGTLRAIRKDVE